MAELACADDDRHRTLDAKLAEAPQKVLKGKPARKVALAAERAALSEVSRKSPPSKVQTYRADQQIVPSAVAWQADAALSRRVA